MVKVENVDNEIQDKQSINCLAVVILHNICFMLTPEASSV